MAFGQGICEDESHLELFSIDNVQKYCTEILNQLTFCCSMQLDWYPRDMNMLNVLLLAGFIAMSSSASLVSYFWTVYLNCNDSDLSLIWSCLSPSLFNLVTFTKYILSIFACFSSFRHPPLPLLQLATQMLPSLQNSPRAPTTLMTSSSAQTSQRARVAFPWHSKSQSLTAPALLCQTHLLISGIQMRLGFTPAT